LRGAELEEHSRVLQAGSDRGCGHVEQNESAVSELTRRKVIPYLAYLWFRVKGESRCHDRLDRDLFQRSSIQSLPE